MLSLYFINIHHMNIIYALDDFNPNKDEQCVRLKKKYNITLLNIFPKVLENIIHNYVNDIINVNIKIINSSYYGEGICVVKYNAFFTNQYINCKYISFSCVYTKYSYVSTTVINNVDFNMPIGTQLINTEHNTSHPVLFNKFMNMFYDKIDYIQAGYVFHTGISYNSNILAHYTRHRPDDILLQIQINDYKLFKNMIVMIKCLMKKIDKS